MLKLPNFGHMNIPKISFGLHDKILLVATWSEIMLSKHLFKMSIIYKRITNYVLKCISYRYFPI